MATKKQQKKAAKTAKKIAKKYPKLFLTLVLIALLACVVVFLLIKFNVIDNPFAQEQKTVFVDEIPSSAEAYTLNKNADGTYSIGKKTNSPNKGEPYVYIEEKLGITYLYYFNVNENTYQKILINKNDKISLDRVVTINGDGQIVSYKEEMDPTPDPTPDPAPDPTPDPVEEGKIIETVIYDDFQIHFMTLGNEYAGDSIYIKAGELDILIDAGSRSGSTSTIEKYINKYCTDGKLEYVIATHGHQDHIAGMVGNYTTTAGKYKNFKGESITTSNAGNNKSYNGILYYYEIGTLIDYTYTNSTANVATEYEYAVNYAVSKGATHYDACDLFGASKKHSNVFELSTNIVMTILETKYYTTKASDENDYSVVSLFTANNKNFLLTGDLEESGETSLVQLNSNLPKVECYKAGHHGSKTSSNDVLLDKIQPKMCVVSCCCGTNEYTGILNNQFPTQLFIDRIAKWTDLVYVTSIYESYTIEVAEANAKGASTITGVAVGKEYNKTTGFKDMNGTVVVSTNGKNIGLYCSNNYIKLKDSTWFNEDITINGVTRKMRTWPSA